VSRLQKVLLDLLFALVCWRLVSAVAIGTETGTVNAAGVAVLTVTLAALERHRRR
jgi:hypothetical protein